MRFIMLVLCVVVPATVLARKVSCEYTVERVSGADTDGVEKVVIFAGAGQLQVTGRADARRLDAHGIVCSQQQGLLAVSTLAVHREGKVIFVEARLPENDPSLAKGSFMAPSMTLTISLPAGIPVDANHWGYDATFEDLASLKLQDRSGNLRLRRIAGAVEVSDGTGGLEIENAGSVRVRGDGPGRIEYHSIRGKVSLPERGNH